MLLSHHLSLTDHLVELDFQLFENRVHLVLDRLHAVLDRVQPGIRGILEILESPFQVLVGFLGAILRLALSALQLVHGLVDVVPRRATHAGDPGVVRDVGGLLGHLVNDLLRRFSNSAVASDGSRSRVGDEHGSGDSPEGGRLEDGGSTGCDQCDHDWFSLVSWFLFREGRIPTEVRIQALISRATRMTAAKKPARIENGIDSTESTVIPKRRKNMAAKNNATKPIRKNGNSSMSTTFSFSKVVDAAYMYLIPKNSQIMTKNRQF